MLKVLEVVAEKQSFGDKLNNNVGQVIFWCAIGVVGLCLISSSLNSRRKKR